MERAFGVLEAQFAIVRYPALSWSHDQIWEVIHACVIMHNMTIEDGRKNHVRRHVGPYECQDPLAEVDRELPANFANFLAIHVEIRDSNVHSNFKMISLSICGGSKDYQQMPRRLDLTLFITFI
jgi:hypothetical protein